MSVIVKGIDVPSDCDVCWHPTCNLWLQTDVGKRHKDCPISPMPEKHGRLIDADAFIQQCRIEGENHTLTHDLNRYKLGMGELIDLINVQPTIVEAEGD